MFLENKWRTTGQSLSSVNYIPDLHPATQIEIRRNTPSPPSSSSGKGKQYFTALAAAQNKKPNNDWWKNNILIYVLGRWRPQPCPSCPTIRCCSGSSLRGCPAASRLFSLPGEEGVGRSVGYAPTCVCSVSQCRRWQLDGAQTHRPAALYAQKDDLGERLPEQQQQHPICRLHCLFI